MNAIERLMKEHRQIESVLSALEHFYDGLRVEDEAQKDRLRKIVDFLIGFVDTVHHGKEEKLLFATMYKNGFSKDTGPIAVMNFEHDQGRDLIGVMRGIAKQEINWTADDRAKLTNAGRGYVSLLRSHIQKEDNILYQMAKTTLPVDVMSELDNACMEFDDAHLDEITRLNTLAVALC
ncbi:MAG: hemerythrin [bacterium]|nr:hemerythrin [bacterium]